MPLCWPFDLQLCLIKLLGLLCGATLNANPGKYMYSKCPKISNTLYNIFLPELVALCVCFTKRNTVDSRYLELQGTLKNTSRYPYFDISDLQT